MPQPTREDRIAAREADRKLQQERNAAAFKANPEFGEHDAEAAKAAKAGRQQVASATPARRPGSHRTVSFPKKPSK